jgi:hypothetical protein
MIDPCEFDGLFDGSLMRLYAPRLTPSREWSEGKRLAQWS